MLITENGDCTVGGMPVSPSGDEALHDAVLNYLYRLAMATGHPVRASVHDARSGYLTPIEVQTDGSSQFAGTPEQVAPPAATPAAAPAPPPAPDPAPAPAPAQSPAPAPTPAPAPSAQPAPSPAPSPAASPVSSQDAAPFTGPAPSPEPVPAAEPQARPHPQPIEQQGAPAAQPAPHIPEPAPHAPTADPRTAPSGQPAPAAYAPSSGRGAPAPQPAPRPGATAPPSIPPALADAVTRINDAVQLGRLEFAAATANSALSSAVQEFGVGHPYVLHLQELFAHIAYLAHDTVKSVAIYLDVFHYRHKQNDPTAYDTFLRAAKVWLAIKDPQQALVYGQQLIHTWVELARPGGPAAADGDKIEAARKRLARLAQHAGPPGQSPV
ncbi:hypothetical protein C3486_11980 [Streptomyces sp. Ru73]|nr:hypothetical protein C3486_11980 [Streptomyces sp. Ru73]